LDAQWLKYASGNRYDRCISCKEYTFFKLKYINPVYSEHGTLSLASTSTVSQTSELPSPAPTSLPVSPSSEIHTQLQSLPVLLDTDTPREIGNLTANERFHNLLSKSLQRKKLTIHESN
jgi:hypothetical protein